MVLVDTETGIFLFQSKGLIYKEDPQTVLIGPCLLHCLALATNEVWTNVEE